MTEIKLRCKGIVDSKVCGRFLPLDIKGTTITRIRCSDRKCKAWNNIKVIFPDATDEQINYKFEEQNEPREHEN